MSHTMRTTTRRIHTILFALVLISCSTTTAVQTTPDVVTSPTTTPTNDISPDVTADIVANYTRWKNANIQHYRFQLMVGCFCPMSSIMPITVEVRNGQVTSMTDVNGTLISPKDPGVDFFAPSHASMTNSPHHDSAMPIPSPSATTRPTHSQRQLAWTLLRWLWMMSCTYQYRGLRCCQINCRSYLVLATQHPSQRPDSYPYRRHS